MHRWEVEHECAMLYRQGMLRAICREHEARSKFSAIWDEVANVVVELRAKRHGCRRRAAERLMRVIQTYSM